MTTANKTRIAISSIAGAAAIAHMAFPPFIPDLITAGLLLLAISPWLAPVFKSIELTGVGKLELQLDAVEKHQSKLQLEVDSLRFLVSGFVTDWELKHLDRLSREGPVPYKRGPERGVGDRFVQEIIRLRDLGLVSKKTDTPLWDMALQDDLSKYVQLTERGRMYLRLRSEFSAPQDK